MDKKRIAKRINVTMQTLYNWEKTKPELIKLIKYGLKYENGEEIGQNEIIKYFNELEEIEKEFYTSEIKAKVLKRKLKENE
ncbi:TetR/AcrR family transcriptional regulator [Campylobacter jejuni]|uniref:TetR/AcrR family transcriptional regulator n=1 Tax=Campylobacter jejuni TaxID=197 RepID=UPI0012C9BF5D|nr:TetR/AcrR family transcriptional regulator [Campylobacter jejuni]EAI1449290.1 TetR/AcrR family transcriptional regulator [Campylobacter jejuni]EAL6167022.1 TetR/AcrR family transcriptional regulator [Campylobacter jejuni]EDO8116774.1 TetR/AcrR family transcriptional regulator [Campylobacter jejuni]EFP1458170.1 TetR/AcrR family transcriptional regulator [Campylobacter jejuni]